MRKYGAEVGFKPPELHQDIENDGVTVSGLQIYRMNKCAETDPPRFDKFLKMCREAGITRSELEVREAWMGIPVIGYQPRYVNEAIEYLKMRNATTITTAYTQQNPVYDFDHEKYSVPNNSNVDPIRGQLE